jgi:hypothetical protein
LVELGNLGPAVGGSIPSTPATLFKEMQMNVKFEKPKIKLLATKETFDDTGDLLCGQVFIIKQPVMDLSPGHDKLLPLMMTSDPWITLTRYNVDAGDLKTMLEYECPWSDNRYYWFMPNLILVRKDVGIYRQGRLKDKEYDYYFDTAFIKHIHGHNIFELDNVHRAFLGHGYTDSTLPSDGSGRLEKAAVALENGDFLLGWTWIWFNK